MISSPSVMVVDDESDLARLYCEYLQIHGVESVYFTDPYLALNHFKGNPDKCLIVVTDFRMPGMSGLELAQKIREISSNVKIFLISAYDVANKETNPQYKHLNIERIIQKPIKLSSLKQEITSIVTS